MCLIVTVIILSCVINYQHNQIIIIKTEKNYYQQSMSQLEKEIEGRKALQEIKDELSERLETSKTLEDYVQIWKRLNDLCSE